jgi:hypothetical protein
MVMRTTGETYSGFVARNKLARQIASGIIPRKILLHPYINALHLHIPRCSLPARQTLVKESTSTGPPFALIVIRKRTY